MADSNPNHAPETIKIASNLQVVEGIASTEITAQFNVHQAKFAALANSQEFEAIKENLIEIDIESALNFLNEESHLEVTVPMIGMCDLLGGDAVWENLAQPFATVMAINGYGAQLDASASNHFPRADYVLATDILGNQYEVVVGPQGQIELPEDGLGLFSILSDLTFMFSYEQVKVVC